jgi:hypothetical protein
MSEIKVNKISPRTNCGTVTLGDSGDTITIPSGATITNAGTANGFGATGAVNWQTTKKTANFTASSGEGYFCDTAAVGSFTLTLPSSPSAGDIVGLKDYNGNFATANLIIGRGGSNLDGNAGDKTLSTDNLSLTLVYVDATQGWVPIEEGTGFIGQVPAYITATGGTITTVCTNFKVHTFTGPGTFCVSCAGNSGGSNTVSYVVVAGGGGGGKSSNGGSRYGGGGGGAGGYRESKASSDCYTAPCVAASGGLPVAVSGYPITVGGGGPTGPGSGGIPGGKGSNSVFTGTSTITAAGGGGGTSDEGNCNATCKNGGSGGGGSALSGANPAGNPGGTGNTPSTSPAQGTPGFAGSPSTGGAGGGGGAGGPSCATPFSLTGKDGSTSSINGTPTARAGGGGGGSPSANTPGGPGGGGSSGIPASAGTANTGGGGGGSNHQPPSSQPGAAGGSGIVIIRYRFQN